MAIVDGTMMMSRSVRTKTSIKGCVEERIELVVIVVDAAMKVDKNT